MSVVITAQDTAKLADLGCCVKLTQKKEKEMKHYDVYSPEPLYVNMTGKRLFFVVIFLILGSYI